MPFISEEIYQEHFKRFEKDKSIHISIWPEVKWVEQKNLDIVSKWGSLIELLEWTRKWKSKEQKAMNAECVLTFGKHSQEDLKEMMGDFKNVTNAKEIKEGPQFRVNFID